MRNSGTFLKTRWSPWLSWALWGAAVGGLVYLTGLTVWLAVTGLVFPYQLDYGEGVMLYFVREWAAGQPIYRPLGHYPLVTANYPPLTLLLALAWTPVLGITYMAGRIWTALAIAGLALLIGGWVHRAGGRRLPAWVAALAFAGSPYIYHWAPLFRVDLLGLALTLGGLYLVWRSQESDRSHLLWGAVFCFVGALYAKQSFLFAPAAALIYLLLRVNRRRALQLAGGIILLGGGLFLGGNLLTHGGFWEGLVVSNVNRFLWPEFWKHLGDFFRTFAVLIGLTAWYAVDKYLLERATPRHDRISPLDLYLLTSLASLGLAGKAGAWENYFFEALAAFSIGAGLGLTRLVALSPIPRGEKGAAQTHPAPESSPTACLYRLALAPALVLIQVALIWHTPNEASRYLRWTRQSNKAIAPIVDRTPDPILSEDMGLLVTHGKALEYYSFQYSQLARAGRWDQSWELTRLRNREFSLVILERGTRLDVDRFQRFTRELLSELDRNYAHTDTVGKYELYRPDPLQRERRAEFGNQLALVGWSLPLSPELKPGDSLTLTVVWQAQQKLGVDYTAFAHLVDGKGHGWAGDDHAPYRGLYPTSAWGAGEMVRDRFTLTVPADAPPGLYDVQVGWYDPASGERLSVDGGNAVRIAVVPIAGEEAGTLELTPLGLVFGGFITLEGYSLRIEPDSAEVILRWSTDRALDTEYTVFLHLVAADDPTRIAAQDDAPPLAGRWPTSLWVPSRMVDDAHTVPLPADLAPGKYRLLVGLYEPGSGERLLLPDGNDALLLSEIDLPAR
ncbi:MAG: glycosyltransferase family 39 protein [Anaerolineae bacterium]